MASYSPTIRQREFNALFMGMAHAWSAMAYCEKRKVGCVITKNNHIIATGYNGTAPGEPNHCEDAKGATLPTVRHAEINALEESNIGLKGSTLYCTLAPCINCAQALVDAGVIEVHYIHTSSKGEEGLRLLVKNKLRVLEAPLK